MFVCRWLNYLRREKQSANFIIRIISSKLYHSEVIFHLVWNSMWSPMNVWRSEFVAGLSFRYANISLRQSWPEGSPNPGWCNFFFKLDFIENLCFEFQKICIDFKDLWEKFVTDFSTGFNLDSQHSQWIPLKTQSHGGKTYQHIQMLSISAPMIASMLAKTCIEPYFERYWQKYLKKNKHEVCKWRVDMYFKNFKAMKLGHLNPLRLFCIKAGWTSNFWEPYSSHFVWYSKHKNYEWTKNLHS